MLESAQDFGSIKLHIVSNLHLFGSDAANQITTSYEFHLYVKVVAVVEWLHGTNDERAIMCLFWEIKNDILFSEHVFGVLFSLELLLVYDFKGTFISSLELYCSEYDTEKTSAYLILKLKVWDDRFRCRSHQKLTWSIW